MAVSKPAAARELGAELRKLRDAAGLTLRAVESRAGISNAKISFWETGQRLASQGDLTLVLDAIGATGDDRERLLGKWRAATEEPGQLLSGAPRVAAALAQLIEQEQAARRITTVSPLLMPGLLQISSYAREIFGEGADANTRLAIRMGRQEILTRPRNPVELHALIDAEVLSRPVATAEAMADQLRHLLRMAKLPNVTIQIVPSTKRGYSMHMAGAFILFEFPSAAPIVHLEHYRASATLWDDEDVSCFAAAAAEVAERAMTPARSAEVIAELANGTEPR
ncbi:helix-turn-helix domain-containing protein [Actinokineospora sp.]|uniref:helix-turn-helix domain-containing protein n=1 Tax=Actinokineospora sp. TaxID=1872133 RepID=UPI003D6C50C9